tara:strand:- start:412 stop:768 length:357 start_codon:yes stop_codon:yes gene_type:complete
MFDEKLVQEALETIDKKSYEDYRSDDTEGSLLIDVRELNELQKYGSIDKATNIPLGEIESKFIESNLNKDTPIYLYCAVGIRSAISGLMLNKLGFLNIYNLGGYEELIEQGAPTKKMI